MVNNKLLPNQYIILSVKMATADLTFKNEILHGDTKIMFNNKKKLVQIGYTNWPVKL